MMNYIKNSNKKILYSDLSLLLVALIWGGGFIATKGAIETMEPYNFMFIRFLLSALIMICIFHKRIKKIDKGTIMGGFLLGVFVFIGFTAQTIGLLYTTVGNNAFITGSNVVFVPFVYWLIIKKVPDVYSFIAAFIAIIGIGFLSLNSNFQICKGDGITLICAVFFAFHIVTMEYYTKRHDPILITIMQFVFATVFFFVAVLMFEKINFNIEPKAYMPMIYLIIVSTIVAFVIQSIAQKYTESTHASLILCLESVFASVFAIIFLDEKITLKMFIGCILIFTSIIIAETKLDFLKRPRYAEDGV